MFRRNCDLRRHRLTHAIGGDVTADPLDGTDVDANLDEDEDDIELEVDSPIHSPVTRQRSASPSLPDDHPLDEDDDIGKEFDHGVVALDRKRHVEVEMKEDASEAPEVTHCHHNGDGRAPYTMRPAHEIQLANAKESGSSSTTPLATTSSTSAAAQTTTAAVNANEFAAIKQHQSNTTTSKLTSSEPYMPMLHVRRDLHQKSAIVLDAMSTVDKQPSILTDPGAIIYAGSIPFRKRTHNGFLRDPHLGMINPTTFLSPASAAAHMLNPLNLSGTHPLAGKSSGEKCSSTPLIAPLDVKLAVQQALGGKIKTESAASNAQSPSAVPIGPTTTSTVQPHLVQPKQQAVPQAAQPPRRTGFSIEDIMRR